MSPKIERQPTYCVENANYLHNYKHKMFISFPRSIMESSLSKCKSLRPSGQWGFYLFPECYNYDGDRTCPNETKEENNQ